MTAALVSQFRRVRDRTEALAAPLSPEDQTIQTMPDVSPTKWHRAHVTWFFETFLLKEFQPGYQPVHPQYNYLFNSYYEAVGARHPRPERGYVARPGAAEIGKYRASVDEAMIDLIASEPEDESHHLNDLVTLGLHHEQQHQELLLMDIKHVLSMSTFAPAYLDRMSPPADDPGKLSWTEIEGASATIGLERDCGGFAFDNEFPAHDVLLQPYRLANRLVTCGEYAAFIADGGYERPELWLSDGWHHAQSVGWRSPLYWIECDSGWEVHTLLGQKPIDLSEPVCHVSFYEADAFATWAGHRLPTECEWEHAAKMYPIEGTFLTDNPTDASLHPQSGAGAGLRQLFGDCWEWTGSPYRPYPGYQTPDGAIGEYNGKFMINTMVSRGGCALTPPGHTRATYRNFFHPHTRWHMSGIRLASDG